MQLTPLSISIITSLALVIQAAATDFNLNLSDRAASLLSEDVPNIQPRTLPSSSSDRSRQLAQQGRQQTENPPGSSSTGNPHGAPSREPSRSPSGSPARALSTTAEAKEAEARASRARTHFKQTSAFHEQRMKEMASMPHSQDLLGAYKARSRVLAQYRAVPVAKQVQADAYAHAAEAAGKAGMPDRQERNHRKAAAAKASTQYLHAHIDRLDNESKLGALAQQHMARWWEPELPGQQLLLKAVNNAGEQLHTTMTTEDRLRKQASDLRRNEGGKDTDSDVST